MRKTDKAELIARLRMLADECESRLGSIEWMAEDGSRFTSASICKEAIFALSTRPEEVMAGVAGSS